MTAGPAAYSFEWAAVWRGLPYLIEGAGLTVYISIIAMVLAVLLGLLLAAISQVPGRWAPRAVRGYVEVFRNTPLLIQIFIVYFGLPQLGFRLSPFLSGLSALVLYAAASIGLTATQALRHVIVPQALRISFPALGNNLVSLVKNSSLVSTIGMVELMFVANDISFNNFRTFEIYGAAAVLYVILVLGLTRLLRLAEIRLARAS